MTQESHPWLKWPGCDAARKIELNNRLADMQNRSMCPPRFIDGEVVRKLGIETRLMNMFLTKIREDGALLEIPMWNRALNIKEQVYREWCLEFYASLRVDKKFMSHEFYSKKLISFRLGGTEHNISVAEFGFLTGLFTRDESRNRNVSPYLLKGKLSFKDFSAEANSAWMELTRLPKHSSLSKVSAIRAPILRLVHKLLVYSFIHRSTQYDKCYLEDLWLLHTFNQGDSGVFVCVPWVLVCFMEAKGAGKTKDSQICCGHFITRMVKNLGLYNQASVRACSPPVNFKMVTLRDLEASKLLNKAGTALVQAESDSEEEVEEEPVLPVRQTRRGREALVNELKKVRKGLKEIQKTGERMERKFDCSVARYEYHMDRYQPCLEELAIARAAAAGTSLPPYAPPPPYAPEESSEEEESDEESDEEEVEEEE